ncbi:MAG TPA: uracil-DNA glycosylase [Dehalococcoidia bacterium]|jgi:DNA polymerase|nr:uracil-DNA glycosylase [Chloroflexota bacterium]HIM59037.1 uracil-DNA glycosylase [Dehalococcoidia bacterium]
MPGSSDWSSIEEIAGVVRTCTKCRLHAGRTNAVPGAGSSVASILIIGEGPGFNENQQGLPFVGRSGKLLDELLAAVPLSREDVFITNVVKCRPPDNRDPQPDEVAACRPYLERQMELINPKVVVTLGRHSYLRFYPDGKISRDHGKILQWNDRILFPLYHPAAGLRNPAIKRELQEDVLRLPEALRESLRITTAAVREVNEVPYQPEQVAAQPPTSIHVQTAPEFSPEEVKAGASLSEPVIENETTEKEGGERQLGFF